MSIEDAGLQHAVGLFETFQVFHGKPFRLERHLQRLAGSAAALGLAERLDTAPLAEAVRQTIEYNRLERARVKLTLTAGTLSLLRRGGDGGAEARAKPTVAVVPSEATRYDPAYLDRGVTVTIHGPSASPFDELAGHKTLSYWARLRSLRRAASVGAGETIWLNVSNHLASGAVSNLLLIRDGVLLSPFARGEEAAEALRAPVLPGVTRQAIFELAAEQAVEVRRKMLSVEDLLEADEVFLTNSGWGVLPVTAVEKRTVADGEPGPLTRSLKAGLDRVIERECQSAD